MLLMNPVVKSSNFSKGIYCTRCIYSTDGIHGTDKEQGKNACSQLSGTDIPAVEQLKKNVFFSKGTPCGSFPCNRGQPITVGKRPCCSTDAVLTGGHFQTSGDLENPEHFEVRKC